jgi:hypothetical protein
MSGGRPTDLTEDMVEKAQSYLDACYNELPSKEGLAIYLDVARSTVYEWCKGESDLHKAFSDIFEKVMTEQGKRLINGGVYGRFNPTITKLMLSKHGYVEQKQTDLTSGGETLNGLKNLSDEELDERIARHLARRKSS